MNTNRVLMGGIAGGVALFFLGWIIYGMLLMDFMMNNGNHCAMRTEADFIWWAMILSCILAGYFYAIIFELAGIRTAMGGAKTGAVLGGIGALSVSLGTYAMSTEFANVTALLLDAVGASVMNAIAGALIAWILGRTTRPPGATPATV